MSAKIELPFYQVDAFTDRPFAGNPAAVCPLLHWLPDPVLQAIARENNLSETAFFVSEGDAGDHYRLRWFTPTKEVDLCGHATLASAFVLLTEMDDERADHDGGGQPARREQIRFETRSGTLTVRRASPAEALPAGALVMDFPSRPPQGVPDSAELREALGATPAAVLASRDLVAVFDDADAVRGLHPRLPLVASLPYYALSVTGPGTGVDADVDFVSRFFAPRQGIDEDPVTGSAHCTLAPYWSERLGKSHLRARQVSARGGDLICAVKDDRVEIAGVATLVIRGRIFVPANI